MKSPFLRNVNEDTSPEAGGDFDFNNKRAYDIKVMDFKAPSELTLDTDGAMTVTQTFHTVDTFEDAGSDDLVTINGYSNGRLLVIKAVNAGRTIVVKHNTGNIWLQGKLDISLDDISDGLMLVYSSTDSKWFDISAGCQTHTMLDGVMHTDSVADEVTRGSLMYGNATPKWDELVKGAVNTFLGSDGTDISYRTAAQVLASLSGAAGATFDLNDQSLTGATIVIDTTLAKALEITSQCSTAQLYIGGSGILASGEQAIYINCPSETVATNGVWITLKSTATTGDLTGVRSRVYGNSASDGMSIRGGYFEAKMEASKYAAMIEGLLAHADYSSGSVTVSGDIRGITAFISQGSGLNAANLYGELIHVQTRGDETITSDDIGLLIRNEAVGGDGRMMDCALKIADLNMGGGTKGFDIGIDLTGATYNTSAIKLGGNLDANSYALTQLKGLLFASATELTMDTNGAITVTQMVHTVDTFENAASDNLDTINGGTTVGLIIIRPAHGDRTVVVRDGQGNIELQGGVDITLDVITDHMMLFWDTTNSKWVDFGGGGGDGNGVAAHAILDGSVHTDSVADAVTRGSIIFGNATPKWDELVKGGADTFLGSDGTDVSYRTAAQVLASLSGEAGATFSMNDQILSALKGALNTAETELTLDNNTHGTIAVTQMRHKVDTYDDQSTGELATINGGGTVNLIILRAENDGRTIVIEHGQDNIWLQGKADISLDDLEDGIMLAWDSTNSKWFDIAAGGAGGVTTFLGLTDTPASYSGKAGQTQKVNDGENALEFVARGWEVLDDHYFSGAATSYTISSLDGNTDALYAIFFLQKCHPSSVYNAFIRWNNDSGANYEYEIGRAEGTVISALTGSDSGIALCNPGAAGKMAWGLGFIMPKSGNARQFWGLRGREDTARRAEIIYSSWTNTADELTSIAFVASDTDGIAIGSRIILMRKR